MSNRLTIKGQVTIPKEIRDFLGLTSGGSAVEFKISQDGTVLITKATEAQEPVRVQAASCDTAAAPRRRGGFDVLSLLSGVCA